MAFAIIAVALTCGGCAERMRFSAVVAFTTSWLLLVYCPLAHWVWHQDGFLLRAGVLDFAGGDVVHVSSGVSSLVNTLMLGHRRGFGTRTFEPHNLSTTLLGASFLWVGWFGFNAGSSFGANAAAGVAMVNSQVATGAGGIFWCLAEWASTGRPTLLALISGAVAGLVVITPAAGYVDPWAALLMGASAGLACCFAVQLKHRLVYDDSLDAFGVHGIGGMLGGLLTGCFAQRPNSPVNGLFHGRPRQLGLQLYGIVVSVGYCGVMSYWLLKLIDESIGLRVVIDDELDGLDMSVHGESVHGMRRNSVHLDDTMRLEDRADRRRSVHVAVARAHGLRFWLRRLRRLARRGGGGADLGASARRSTKGGLGASGRQQPTLAPLQEENEADGEDGGDDSPQRGMLALRSAKARRPRAVLHKVRD